MSYNSPIVLFLFAGLSQASPVEAMVSAVWQAIALDIIGRAGRAAVFDRIVVATNSARFAQELEGAAPGQIPLGVEVDRGPFHFGQRLQELVRRHQPGAAFYLGAGSGPLLSEEEMASAISRVAGQRNAVTANNFYSADMVGFSPATALDRIDLPPNDNDLAYRLVHQAGLGYLPMPRTTGSMFDVDTPTDLAILRLHPMAGPHTQRALAKLALDVIPLAAALPVVRDPMRQAIVAGRVSQAVWARLESDFGCGIRVFAEERGMRASGREERGEVKSLLGFLLEEVGPWDFFRRLADLAQAAFLDSRVLFHHCHWQVSAADRFSSDLLDAEHISHPQLQEFTIAAKESPIPVVLGGHSLVSGGLWALADVLSSQTETEARG